MGHFFQRINEIFVGGPRYRVDNPAVMLKNVILEMEAHVRAAKAEVINAVAAEKRIANEMREAETSALKWREKAAIALREGREDLASGALRRKQEKENVAKELAGALKSAQNTSRKLKDRLKGLTERFNQIRRETLILKAKQTGATAATLLHREVPEVDGVLATYDDYQSVKERVTEMEARAEAISEIEQDREEPRSDIDTLVRDRAVKEELEELRKEIS